MALSKEKKLELIEKFGENANDTGSTKVQIAILTEEIKALTLHLKANKHDGSSRRGLFSKVGQRRGLLDYLARKDHDAYVELIKELGIRK